MDAAAPDTPPLGKRAAAKAQTRQQLIEVARKLFDWKKYEAVTLRDIARTAGLSTGALFSNFENKEDLYAAVYGFPYVHPQDRLDAIRLALTEADGAALEIGGDVILPLELYAGLLKAAFPEGFNSSVGPGEETTPEIPTAANDDAAAGTEAA